MQDQVGVDVFRLARNNYLFCGSAGAEGKRNLNSDTLGVTGNDMMVCNKGCNWRALGDGHCNPQCNNTACFWDRLDCEHDDGSCPADCHPDWIGDGYCDEACFNAKCQ